MGRVGVLTVFPVLVLAVGTARAPQLGCVGDLMCGDVCVLTSTSCADFSGADTPYGIRAQPACPIDRGCQFVGLCACAKPPYDCDATVSAKCARNDSELRCSEDVDCAWSRRCRGTVAADLCSYREEDDCKSDRICRWERHCN